MTMDRETVQDQALDWAVRTGDPAFDGWDEFTAWLERDPAHADAYHDIVDRLADADGLLPLLRPRAAAEPAVVKRPPWRAAMAACVAILAAAGAIIVGPAFTTDGYATAPGEMRTIALGEGNVLVMNGDTRLQLAGLRRDEVRLEQGQVLLRLDGEPRVTVRSGDLQFVDIGTTFEVTRESAATRLLVSEGAVMADPDGAQVTVGAHQMLEAADGARTLAVKPASGEAGSWSRGQLSYVDAPVDRVLEDLHRSTGLAFSPSAAMSARRYTGTLSTAEIRKDPASLGPLLGVSVKRADDRWEVGEE